MSDYNELLDILKHLLLNRFAPKPSYTRGLLGDGQGNVQVPDRPDKSYVRFNRGSTEYFEVFNRTVNPVNDWPILIGELPWQPGLTQVVDTDWAAFEQSGWGDSLGDTSPHAPTHEWPDGSPGSDPVNVHLRSIVPLRAYSLTGTTIYVNSLEYEWQGSGHVWGGLPGVDLAPVISDTATGTMRYAGIYLEPTSNSLMTVTGTTTVHSSALTPPLVQFPAGVVPAGRIKIYGNQAAINEADIFDARRPFDPIGPPTGDAGGDLTGSYPNPQVAGLYGSSLLSDTPVEGDLLMFSGSAWRPLKLSDIWKADGGAVAWATDALGGLAGQAVTSILESKFPLDQQLVDTYSDAIVSHFQDYTATYPTGWTEVDAPVASSTNSVYSFWRVDSSNTNTSWEYKIQTNTDVEVDASGSWIGGLVGPLFFDDKVFTADVSYFLRYCRDNSGIDPETFVGAELQYDSAGTQWRLRGQTKDSSSGTLQSGSWLNFSVPPNIPLWVQFRIRESDKQAQVGYATGFPLVKTAFQQNLLNVAATTALNFNTAWFEFSQSRGAGAADKIFIGCVDLVD